MQALGFTQNTYYSSDLSLISTNLINLTGTQMIYVNMPNLSLNSYGIKNGLNHNTVLIGFLRFRSLILLLAQAFMHRQLLDRHFPSHRRHTLKRCRQLGILHVRYQASFKPFEQVNVVLEVAVSILDQFHLRLQNAIHIVASSLVWSHFHAVEARQFHLQKGRVLNAKLLQQRLSYSPLAESSPALSITTSIAPL